MVPICMITLVPANISIPETGIENGAYTNDDGHGFAIASANLGIEVFKSMKYSETIDALFDARSRHGQNSVVLFHSRFGTHGEMGEYNVHPFWVGDDGQTVMAHNGILPSMYHPLGKDRRSDTRIFVDWVTRDYCDNPNGVPSRRGSQALSSIIGSSNKLTFLSIKSGKPKVRIVNAHLGDQVGGVWYSNSGYRWTRSWSTGWKGSQYDHWYDDPKWSWNTYDNTYEDKGNGTLRVVGGKVEYEVCPVCKSDEDMDLSAGICLGCEFCVDCNDFLTDCLCYLPTSAKTVGEDEDGVPLRLVEIEDQAGSGYVKVEGVWGPALTLIHRTPKEQTKALVCTGE